MDKAEQQLHLMNKMLGEIVGKAGILYFEYDPQNHSAIRTEATIGDGLPDLMENFPTDFVKKSVKNEEQAKNFLYHFDQVDAGSAKEHFVAQIEILGKVHWFEYNLIDLGLVENRRILCIVYDITESYVEESMDKILMNKQFEGVSLIDAEEHSFTIRFFKNAETDGEKISENYEEASITASKKYVTASERELFIERISLENIQKHLEKAQCYSFILKGLDKTGENQLYQYCYYYLDTTKRFILATLEDVTKVMDHDVLTGEFNRSGFIRRVEGVLKECADREQYAILFFNIKGFKAINDLLGVEGGDFVLRETANILRNSFLSPIATARFEADHFVVFTERKNIDFGQLGEFCHRTFVRSGKTFSFYARCGIYFLNNVQHDVSGMCDRAKMAKEYIQDDYIKPYSIYDKAMRKEFMKKKALLGDLQEGVNNSEFSVYYQPVYDALTGKIVSAEALVRWIHPKYGIVSPGEFISSFEENGYISQLDQLVEDKTKEFIIDRIRAKKPMVPVAVNLSRMDFYDIDFMNKIIRDVQEIRELDNFCRIEITESAYSVLIDDATEYIKRFKAAGIKILLDDFGSGYSSFSTLSSFDFDILKLDIGFIRKIGVDKKVECIISNIIHMAHELHLQIIAEGVENEIQRDFLKKNKCDCIQGYFYSRPLPKEEFVKLLDS